MTHPKSLIKLLVILVLGVWGTIAYRIYDSMNPGNGSDVEMPLSFEQFGNQQKPTYVYVNDVRDPFRYVVSPRRGSNRRNASATPQAVWSPPPFKLAGILMAKKKRTAMLEGSNGSVYFLQEGDTLSGMRIMKIKEKNVTYVYQKKKADWVLETF